jgi:hypothetical protein
MLMNPAFAPAEHWPARLRGTTMAGRQAAAAVAGNADLR